MLDLIIVEDEPVVRRGLSEYPWNKWNLRLAGAFAGVQETRTWLQSHRADVIITDVRLGDGTGLALCDEVSQSPTPTVTVVLSAYSEFELARHAIDAGVFAYLLKPLDDEELDSVLARAIHALDERRHHNTVLRQMAEQALLRDLVLGRSVDVEAFDLAFPLVVAVIQASPLGWQRVVDHHLERARWWAPIDHGETLALVSVKEMAQWQAGLVAQRLMSGWSGPIDSAAEVAEAFAVARRALAEQTRRTFPDRAEHGALADRHETLYAAWFKTMDAMVQAARGLSRRDWLEGCARLAALSQELPSWQAVRPAVLELLYRIQPPPASNALGMAVEQDWSEIIAAIEEAPRIEDVVDCLMGRLWTLLEQAEHRQEAQRSAVELQRALTFIASHLGSDLSGQATAEHLGMSVSRFSRWFQETMGTHYLDYVTDLRMERARWLLQHSEVAVAVVASEVGYSDARYFKQVFRQRMGIGPGVFRRASRPPEPRS